MRLGTPAKLAILIGAAGLGMALWFGLRGRPPGIPFAPYEKSGGYQTKLDLARVEREYPLSPADLLKLTPQNIRNYDQEQIEQIYARLTAGPIPDGRYSADVFFPRGDSGRPRLAELMAGLKGVEATAEMEAAQVAANAIWKTKIFERNARIVRTQVAGGKLLTDFLNQFFGEQPQAADLRAQAASNQIMFPAKVYCGQSLLDSRRESIIMDYAFNDEIPGYREIPDSLLGHGNCHEGSSQGVKKCVEGMLLRDEIRAVRPGFYLGRAHVFGGVLLLNFSLYRDDVARSQSAEFLRTGSMPQDCWMGPQGPGGAAN